MPTRGKLGLERLEDRTVPAGLNLVWTDAAGTHDWNVAGNWKDTATNQAPASPPTQNDVVTFPGGVIRGGPNLQTWTPNYLATVFDLQGVI
jgi:hypothetical protein